MVRIMYSAGLWLELGTVQVYMVRIIYRQTYGLNFGQCMPMVRILYGAGLWLELCTVQDYG